MDPDTQQYIEVAKKTLDVAEKSGLLKKIVSWRPSRQQELPAQQVDYRKEALLALQDNAVETLAGLTLTVREAVQILEPDFSFEDLDRVNSTWQNHWSEGASKVGLDDEERRIWWANLLAGEIRQPETYSLRTLAVMDLLSTKEARLFTKLCDYVWNPQNPVLILPRETSALWKPSFPDGVLLESASLVKLNGVTGFNWGPTETNAVGKAASATPRSITMVFGGNVYLVHGREEKQARLRCGQLALTDVGKEIYRIARPTHPQLYLDEILEEWQQSYNVLRHTAFKNDS